MRPLLLRALLVAAGVGLASGCKHCCQRPRCADAPLVATTLPPQSGPIANPQTPFVPQTAYAPPGAAQLGAPPEQQGGYAPMPAAPLQPDAPPWQPGPGSAPRVQLRPPEVGSPDAGEPDPLLSP